MFKIMKKLLLKSRRFDQIKKLMQNLNKLGSIKFTNNLKLKPLKSFKNLSKT